MAGLFCEGFEWLGSSTDKDDATEHLQKFWMEVAIGSGAGAAFGTTRGTHYGIELDSGHLIRTKHRRNPDDADTTIILGFYLKTGDSFADFTDWIYIWGGETVQCSLDMNTDGTVDLLRGTTTLLDTSVFAFDTANEYYVEIKIVIADGTGGSLEMKVADLTADGDDAETATEWEVSSVDTKASTSAYETSWSSVTFRHQAATGVTLYDDIVICDGSGSVANNFLGNCIVETNDPTGAGNSTQLTPSTGDNWQNVDETTTPDGDTSYNTADADGELDLYTLSDLSENGDIAFVQVQALARVTEGDPRKCRLAVRSGGSNSEGSDVTYTSETYTGRIRVMDVNPISAAGWTAGDVDGLEIGIKRQS